MGEFVGLVGHRRRVAMSASRDLRGTTLVAATLATGLLAGLFYAFAVAVMIGLHRVDDRTFVGAMQQINVGIQDGWFFISLQRD
ncbi:MAG: hypothetical protein ACRDSR_27715 [Pseudonocardiaceae bacterium]